MYKPTLLLDMDGPMADFDKACWDWADRHGVALDIEHPEHQSKRFFTDHVCYRRDRNALREEIDSSYQWFRELEVTPGAYEGVPELEERFDVWVCTKPLERNPYCRDAKQAWINEHFPTLSNKLIIAPDKSMVRGDLLLDDAIHLDWIERATWKPVVFATPWNGDRSKWANLDRWSWGNPQGFLLAASQEPF